MCASDHITNALKTYSPCLLLWHLISSLAHIHSCQLATSVLRY